MEFTYILFNLLIIAGPLGLSFHKTVYFYRNWKWVFGSMAMVSIPFIIWDVIATERGHWGFSPEYTSGIKLAGLPLGEILFFITVPYACLFTYEVFNYYTEDKDIKLPRPIFLIFGGFALAAAGLFYAQEYTAIVMVVFFITCALLFFPKNRIGLTKNFWIYMGTTLLLFIAFNLFLTGMPVVTYGPDMIWGGDGMWNGRFITIPIEDFFYNFSLLALYVIAYDFLKQRFGRKKD